MDWIKWKARNQKRNKSDKRVQCIRCRDCNRLRAHPRQDDPRTWNCGCGGLTFVSSHPHPDELQLAIRLYSRDIEEQNSYSNVAKEILDDWRAKHPLEGDTPERVRIYSK